MTVKAKDQNLFTPLAKDPQGPSLLFVGGNWFSFQKRIDLSHIIERRAQRTSRNIINAFFVFAGAIGLSFLVFALWQFNESGLRDAVSFFSERSTPMAVFAISLLFDLAVIARFGKLADEAITIDRSLRRSQNVRPPVQSYVQAVGYLNQTEDVAQFFSNAAFHILEDAFLLARKFSHAEVRAIHVLASLLGVQDVRVAFVRLGIPIAEVQKRLAIAFSKIPKGETMLSREYERLALRAFSGAIATDMQHVLPVHLLQVMCREETEAYDVLYDIGIDDTKITNTILWIIFERASSKQYQTWRLAAMKKPKGVMNRSYTAVATPLLDSVSRDLTQTARVGGLSLTIGREQEFEEIFRIFETGSLGVVLVGFPGVGKRSIIQGIAARMASEEVPEILQDKRFVELSLPALVGSAGRQGELEDRLMRIMNEIIRAGNVVLFIENIENIIGLSTEGSRNLDAADVFAQTMERARIPIIATSEPVPYRKTVEGSPLMSVMQKVSIQEVDQNGAIQILEGKANYIEYEHDVIFTYGAIEKSVQLSSRYFHEQYLPEKAVNLLQEVASYVASAKGKNSFVTGEDVASIVSQRANVPVTQVTEEESEKLLHLEDRMHGRVIGQHEAVVAVASALRRARAELRDQKRPIANFLFLGPTGVGKTELAKTVADVYFGDENAMIRLDMSEYQDRTSIHRLIGVPGEASGGYLTESVRTNPFSLVLLDELEKAHPDILNVFLQVMDDGRLTDVVGRTIDFTNTILIATSNAGSNYIQDQIRAKASVERIKQGLLNQELKNYFRPEFLNRFDAVVVFKPLTLPEIVEIVKLLLGQVAKRLEDKGITLHATDSAVKEIADIGFDPVFGARPLRRTIQERVDNALAQALLTRQIGRRDVAVLEKGGTIRIKKAEELRS